MAQLLGDSKGNKCLEGHGKDKPEVHEEAQGCFVQAKEFDGKGQAQLGLQMEKMKASGVR